MISRISKKSTRIVDVLSQNRKPSQIAWGVAVGVMIGLIPKDNLIAVSLLAIIAFLRVNQLAACCVAVAVYCLSSTLSATTFFVGSYVLGQPLVADGIAFLYQFPVLPWTCMENPSVLGGLGVGIVALIPIYVFCRWIFFRAHRRWEAIALEQAVDNALEYRKSVADQSKARQEKPLPTLKIMVQPGGLRALASSAIETKKNTFKQASMTELAKPQAVAKPATAALPIATVNQAAPATQTTPSAQPLDQGHFRRAERKIQQRVMPTLFTGESHADANDTILRETVIEVVRYRRPHSAEKLSDGSPQSSSAVSSKQGISMPSGNISTVIPNVKDSAAFGTEITVPPPSPSLVYDSGHIPGNGNGRDESLRYLLWHINGSRESVRKSSEKTA